MPALKVATLVSWSILLVCQLSLLLPSLAVSYYWSLPLIAALLIPLRGLLSDRLYTYRWIGFMALVYLCVGISELAVNPALRVYGFGTTAASILLFLAVIYRARQLSAAAGR